MKNSDMNVYIPTHTIDSYNANVATALILYHVANYIGKLNNKMYNNHSYWEVNLLFN